MKGKKILFIDTVHPELQSRLEKVGMECIDGSSWTEEKVFAEITTYNGVVIRSRFKIEQHFIDQAIQLEFIARAGAGMENINEHAAAQKGIVCINAPEGNRNAVSEQALGMLLSLLNNLQRSDKEVRNGIWNREQNRGYELDGKTVGIIGFGNTGQAFAKKLRGFDINLLVYDPYIRVNKVDFPEIKQVDKAEIFELCDVVSFHVPLNDETKFMGDSTFFNSFSKPVYLLNTSRGKVVKIDAVVTGIESGKILGAGLDVLEFESISFEKIASEKLPESFRKLITFDNVILTPHIAGWTFESHRKISEVLADKIIAFYKNKEQA
jgi:D-3-phosphoglycerate dehydrogenase / 2-oxoglutarate reductase